MLWRAVKPLQTLLVTVVTLAANITLNTNINLRNKEIAYYATIMIRAGYRQVPHNSIQFDSLGLQSIRYRFDSILIQLLRYRFNNTGR